MVAPHFIKVVSVRNNLMVGFPNHALRLSVLVIHVEKALTAVRVATVRKKMLLCDLFIH